MTDVVEVNRGNLSEQEDRRRSMYNDGLRVCNYVVPWWVVVLVVLVVGYLLFEYSKNEHGVSFGSTNVTTLTTGPAIQASIPESTPAQTRLLFRGY